MDLQISILDEIKQVNFFKYLQVLKFLPRPPAYIFANKDERYKKEDQKRRMQEIYELLKDVPS